MIIYVTAHLIFYQLYKLHEALYSYSTCIIKIMLHWLLLILEAHKEQETEKVAKQYTCMLL